MDRLDSLLPTAPVMALVLAAIARLMRPAETRRRRACPPMRR